MPRARRPAPMQTSRVLPGQSILPWIAGAVLISFVAFCYWPLTRFFLAQDDFVLLERASHGLRESMEPFFSSRPGQFRPLTKGLYFLLAWPAFGLDAFPYHLVSLLVHAFDSILVGVVLRRMGVSTVISWVAALCFAAHMGHMEAVAWASCIQQLIGAGFVFAALIFGIDALEGRGRHARTAAAVAYALALCSYEQVLAAPLVLLLWQWTRRGIRPALRSVIGPLAPMFALLVVYAVYVFGLRGMPSSGPYVMSVGGNVVENLREYTGFSFAFWMFYPQFGLPLGFTPSHVGWLLLILVHAVLGSIRPLLFGCAAFVLFLAPVLLTREHTHSFHLYVPAIGLMFLLASAVDSIRGIAAGRWRLAVDASMVALAVIVAAGSVGAAQRNVTARYSEQIDLPRSFVLRRAVLAQRICDGIRSRYTGTGPGKLVLVYPEIKHAANWRNVQSAVGYGSAIRLMLGDPELDVVFVPPAPMPGPGDTGELIVYSEVGECFTVSEYRAIAQQRGLLRLPSDTESSPGDDTTE